MQNNLQRIKPEAPKTKQKDCLISLDLSASYNGVITRFDSIRCHCCYG